MITAEWHLECLGCSPLFAETARDWELTYSPELSSAGEAVWTDGHGYTLRVHSGERWTIEDSTGRYDGVGWYDLDFGGRGYPVFCSGNRKASSGGRSAVPPPHDRIRTAVHSGCWTLRDSWRRRVATEPPKEKVTALRSRAQISANDTATRTISPRTVDLEKVPMRRRCFGLFCPTAEAS